MVGAEVEDVGDPVDVVAVDLEVEVAEGLGAGEADLEAGEAADLEEEEVAGSEAGEAVEVVDFKEEVALGTGDSPGHDSATVASVQVCTWHCIGTVFSKLCHFIFQITASVNKGAPPRDHQIHLKDSCELPPFRQ